MPRAEASSTRYSVSASASNTVYGKPSSLLNDSGGATVGPALETAGRRRSLVEVLPDEPVISTIRAVNRSADRGGQRGQRRDRLVADEMSGPPTGRVTTAGHRPGSSAAAA